MGRLARRPLPATPGPPRHRSRAVRLHHHAVVGLDRRRAPHRGDHRPSGGQHVRGRPGGGVLAGVRHRARSPRAPPERRHAQLGSVQRRACLRAGPRGDRAGHHGAGLVVLLQRLDLPVHDRRPLAGEGDRDRAGAPRRPTSSGRRDVAGRPLRGHRAGHRRLPPRRLRPRVPRWPPVQPARGVRRRGVRRGRRCLRVARRVHGARRDPRGAVHRRAGLARAAQPPHRARRRRLRPRSHRRGAGARRPARRRRPPGRWGRVPRHLLDPEHHRAAPGDREHARARSSPST